MSKTKQEQPKESLVSAAKYNALLKKNEELTQTLQINEEHIAAQDAVIKSLEEGDELKDSLVEALLKYREVSKHNTSELKSNMRDSLRFIKMLLNSTELDD